MTSTPRLSNGKPPAEKMPRAKPPKAKKPKKMTAPAAKPMEMAAPEPVTPAPVTPAPVPAKPAPAIQMKPKFAMVPVPAFDSAVDSLERSCKAAGQGAQVLGAKLFDMARANMTSSFDFWSSLAAVKHPAEITRLQMRFWDESLHALLGQAQELRTLSAEIVAQANEPIRAHLKQSFKTA